MLRLLRSINTRKCICYFIYNNNNEFNLTNNNNINLIIIISLYQ